MWCNSEPRTCLCGSLWGFYKPSVVFNSWVEARGILSCYQYKQLARSCLLLLCHWWFRGWCVPRKILGFFSLPTFGHISKYPYLWLYTHFSLWSHSAIFDILLTYLWLYTHFSLWSHSAYLTSKEDDKKIYLSFFLSIFVAMDIYYVFNVHYVFSPVIYTLNFVKKIVHIPLWTFCTS